MKLLIAEDDVISSRILEARLTKWCYEVSKVLSGREAYEPVRVRALSGIEQPYLPPKIVRLKRERGFISPNES